MSREAGCRDGPVLVDQRPLQLCQGLLSADGFDAALRNCRALRFSWTRIINLSIAHQHGSWTTSKFWTFLGSGPWIQAPVPKDSKVVVVLTNQSQPNPPIQSKDRSSKRSRSSEPTRVTGTCVQLPGSGASTVSDGHQHIAGASTVNVSG